MPQPSFHFAEQPNSQVFLAFFSSGSDSVLIPSPVPRLCHVFRRARYRSVLYSSITALKKTRRGKCLVSLGCSSCDGLFIARSSGSIDRENARNKYNEDKFIILQRRKISMKPCSWTNISARRSTSARSETAPYSTQICPTPFSVPKRGSKLSHETMKRRQVHDTSTSNDFHEALFLDAAYQRPSTDV